MDENARQKHNEIKKHLSSVLLEALGHLSALSFSLINSEWTEGAEAEQAALTPLSIFTITQMHHFVSDGDHLLTQNLRKRRSLFLSVVFISPLLLTEGCTHMCSGLWIFPCT